MPNQGTLQFFTIEEGGPVDLVFDLDFGRPVNQYGDDVVSKAEPRLVKAATTDTGWTTP